MSGKAWSPDELAILADLFPAAGWPAILAALPGRTRKGIRQRAKLTGLAFRARKRWTGNEISTLFRFYPSADWADLQAALPLRTRSTIMRKAFDLSIKRKTVGLRTNRRVVNPLIHQLQVQRVNLQMSRKKLSKKSGYHVNQLLAWELGKANPHLGFFCDWAKALGFDVILRPKVVSNVVIPWPDRNHLMAGR